MTENNEILNEQPQEEKVEAVSETAQQEVVEEKPADKVDTQKEEQTKNQVLEKYLQKKSFKKKLSYIIAISVSFVVALAIILLAALQVNVVPDFLRETPAAEYSVYHNNAYDYSIDDENARYDEFTELYNNAFDMSVLSAMFSGQVGGYVIGEENETYNQFSSSNVATLLDSQDYIRVAFDEDITVLDSKGNVHKSIRNSQAERIYFNELYIPLQSENDFKEIKIVIPVYGNHIKNNETDYDTPMILQFTVKANLYRFSQSVNEFVK